MLLQAFLKGFALADRQTNGCQLVVALHETQDLAVGENRAIVADDPKLKVNVHGRRHAGVFRKFQGDTAAKLPVFTCPDYQHPTVPVALISARHNAAIVSSGLWWAGNVTPLPLPSGNFPQPGPIT
jgi:hypothetical protein